MLSSRSGGDTARSVETEESDSESVERVAAAVVQQNLQSPSSSSITKGATELISSKEELIKTFFLEGYAHSFCLGLKFVRHPLCVFDQASFPLTKSFGCTT